VKGGHRLTDSGRQGGLTFIEQIIVLCIVATLACVAAPALGPFISRGRLQAAQSDIVAALQNARGLAVHTGQRAMLCPTQDGKHCSDDLHWESGWLVGHYRSERADQFDGEPTLATQGHERLLIVSTSGRRRIRFQADGSAGGSNASFTLCRRDHADGALTVTVANSGRIYGSRATAEQANRCASGG
jgi:type IV fimbrial biogenesis protein FimT